MMALEEKDFLEEDETARKEAEVFFEYRCFPSDPFPILFSVKIGLFLTAFEGAEKITCHYDENLEPSTARFSCSRKKDGSVLNPVIDYGESLNVLIMGHELRHAWWFMAADEVSLKPASPEEYILKKRFIEADARAISVGLAAQVYYESDAKPDYIKHLLATLDATERETFRRSRSWLRTVGSDNDLLKTTMRAHFDKWIALSPAQSRYDGLLLDELDSLLSPTSLLDPEALVRRKGSTEMAFPPSRGVRPEFVQALVGKMGVYNDQKDNYLTQTEGLDFMDPFYTRICNYRLEQLVSKVLAPPATRTRRIFAPVAGLLRRLAR